MEATRLLKPLVQRDATRPESWEGRSGWNRTSEQIPFDLPGYCKANHGAAGVNGQRSRTRSWSCHLPEFELALNTGVRKGSQYGLTWDMVDWKGRMLNIPRTKNEEPVYVPLNDAAMAALRVVRA